jgi:hypothetical protein
MNEDHESVSEKLSVQEHVANTAGEAQSVWAPSIRITTSKVDYPDQFAIAVQSLRTRQ